jgi:hypothetical protein
MNICLRCYSLVTSCLYQVRRHIKTTIFQRPASHDRGWVSTGWRAGIDYHNLSWACMENRLVWPSAAIWTKHPIYISFRSSGRAELLKPQKSDPSFIGYYFGPSNNELVHWLPFQAELRGITGLEWYQGAQPKMWKSHWHMRRGLTLSMKQWHRFIHLMIDNFSLILCQPCDERHDGLLGFHCDEWTGYLEGLRWYLAEDWSSGLIFIYPVARTVCSVWPTTQLGSSYPYPKVRWLLYKVFALIFYYLSATISTTTSTQ